MSGGSRVSPGGSSSQQLLGRAGGQIVADRRSSRPSPGGGPRETPGDSNDRRRPSRSSSRRAPLDEYRWEEPPAAPRSRRAPRGRGPGSPKRTPGAASPPAPPRPETTPRKLAAPRRPPALPRRRRRCDARRRRRGETKRRSRETRRAACGAGEKQPHSGGEGAGVGASGGGGQTCDFFEDPPANTMGGSAAPADKPRTNSSKQSVRFRFHATALEAHPSLRQRRQLAARRHNAPARAAPQSLIGACAGPRLGRRARGRHRTPADLAVRGSCRPGGLGGHRGARRSLPTGLATSMSPPTPPTLAPAARRGNPPWRRDPRRVAPKSGPVSGPETSLKKVTPDSRASLF